MKDIQCSPSNLLLLQGTNQCRFITDATSSYVHQKGRRLHYLESRVVEYPSGLRSQGYSDDYNIAITKHSMKLAEGVLTIRQRSLRVTNVGKTDTCHAM